jgi:hypothetical protein
MFFVVYFNSRRWRNALKRDKPKKGHKTTDMKKFVDFLQKHLLTWIFCKNITVVFLNSSYREAPKNIPPNAF